MKRTDPGLVELRERYFAHLRAANRSERTIIHYTDSFRNLLLFLASAGIPPTLSALTTENCQKYVVWLRATPTKVWRGKTERSIFGVNGHLRDLRAFLGFLRDAGELETIIKVPSLSLPQPEFAVFTDDELTTIFACRYLNPDSRQGTRNRAIFAVLLDTGIRLGELAGLRPDDVNLQDHLMRVTGKSRKTRTVPYSDSTAIYLRAWLKIRGDSEPEFFNLAYSGIRMIMFRVQRETGVHIHPHRFRHTACTTLIRNGVKLSSVRRLMGHSSISTTMRYEHLNVDDLRNDHRRGSPLESLTAIMPDPPKRRRRLDL